MVFFHKLVLLLVFMALGGCPRVDALRGSYKLAFVLQIAFYSLIASRAKFGFLSRLSNISLAFIVLETASVVAFIYLITGRKAVWAR
jgi:hypothetical protein